MICRLCCYILSTMLLLTNYTPIQQGNEMALRHFKPNQYTKDIWNAMVVLFNDNEIGAAAFMGNLYQESNCIPTTNKQSSNYTSRIDNGDISRSTFIQQSQGAYGLVQWYSTARKANLYDGVWDGGEPPSPSNSIGSLNRAFHMIEYEMTDLYADKVVLAVGRKGANWLVDMCKKHNIKSETGIVDIGVRYELPDEIMKNVNKYMYEAKFTGRVGPFRDKVRTFCQNPSGFVATEVYDDNLTLVNGHSYKEKKSTKTMPMTPHTHWGVK